jgi:hypothetical protein
MAYAPPSFAWFGTCARLSPLAFLFYVDSPRISAAGYAYNHNVSTGWWDSELSAERSKPEAVHSRRHRCGRRLKFSGNTVNPSNPYLRHGATRVRSQHAIARRSDSESRARLGGTHGTRITGLRRWARRCGTAYLYATSPERVP